jgi:hypothetical protein
MKESGKNSLFGQAVVVWLGLLVFAVINGYFRVTYLEPQVGSEVAHFVSTTTLCGAVFLATLLFIGNQRLTPMPRDLFGIGLLWSTSTVLFETILGLAAGRRSATDLFADYDLLRGRLFVFVLLAEVTAPPLVGWFRDRVERGPKRTSPSRAR